MSSFRSRSWRDTLERFEKAESFACRDCQRYAKEELTNRRLLHLRNLSWLLVAIVITASSEAVAMDAPTSRIVITSGDSIPGHSQFVILGKVRAHCMENSRTSHVTAADVIADGNLQRSAYRAYGSQVDAIVEANLLYVSHPTLVNPLFDAEGHFECEGTAIHFTGEPPEQSTARPN